MHRFWPVVAELLEITDARRICEIGADNGLHTSRLIEHCRARAAFLEVIDPLPKFDVEAWRARYPEGWTLHASTSIEALPRIDACDLYLIDGDHNWYTVTQELRLIRARAAPGAGPLVLLHDTGWPYGRRDLYYAPERIPAEHRHSFAQRPMLPGARELADHGLNPHLFNAVAEGAPRNGVLTAVEDHVAEAGGELLAVHLRMWFGLTLLVPKARLAANPVLSRFVERLSGLSELGLVENLERERVDLVVAQDVANEQWTRDLTNLRSTLESERRERASTQEELGSVLSRLNETRLEVEQWRRRASDAGAVEEWVELPDLPTPEPPRPVASSRRADAALAVDVVVTVYDALTYVRACLEALRRHADGFEVRVIVVNDGSGPATAEWLRATAAEWPAMHLIEQAGNQGYTRAVNAGLRASTAASVVVLNSDTVVTEGWLAGMLRCADSDARIGLVGPLSNAASWQSVPTLLDAGGGFAVNTLLAGMDPEGMARLVASASTRSYPRVPVLNGFCMLLRRAVLERVGLMDEAAFAIGYGEENDYCLRAADAGFGLAVADDVYVFHAKSKSFGHAERIELSNRGAAALTKKHGASRVQELIRGVRENRALLASRSAVQQALVRWQEVARGVDPFALRVLFLLPILGPSGGANSVLQEAAEMRKMGAHVQIAVPPELLGDLGAHYDEVPEVRELLVGAPLDRLIELSCDFDVVVATVYYTMEWVARIIAAHPEILPAYYVQDYEPWFFAEGSAERSAAEASYSRVPGALVFAKTRWLTELLAQRHGLQARKVLPGLDHATFYPSRRVRAPGMVRVTAMVRPQTPRRAAARTMRVLQDLSRRCGARIEIQLFGCEARDPRFVELERDFPFENRGILRRPEVAELLRSSDLFIDLSDYQAFGRSSLEAMASGCAPIVPLAGGGDEFASDGCNALVVDTSDEALCVARIEALLDTPDALLRMKRAALATAARFSVRRAALSELHVFSDAALVWRHAHPLHSRTRLALGRHGAERRPVLGAACAVAGWRLPALLRAYRVAQTSQLPDPGSADVAVVMVNPIGADWGKLDSWLGQWRHTGARLVVHLELPSTGSAASVLDAELLVAVQWLARAADALTVSTPALRSRLALLGVDATVVPAAFDPILWRIGPAARRLADRRSAEDPLRIGYLGGALPPAILAVVQQALEQVRRDYGDRVAVETLPTAQDAALFGKKLSLPKFETEAAQVDWVLGNTRWDIGITICREDGAAAADVEARFFVYAATGVAVATPASNDSAAWHEAIVQLLEDRPRRERLTAEAARALSSRHQEAETDRTAVALLERVMAAAASTEQAALPHALRGFVRGLFPGWAGHTAKGVAVKPFPRPRSKVQRKLDKLRRDPAAFFRDSKVGPLRLLRGLFD